MSSACVLPDLWTVDSDGHNNIWLQAHNYNKIKLALTLSESAIEDKRRFPTRRRNCYLR